MFEVNDVIVRDGKIEVSHLPFANGQHVRVTVVEERPHSSPKRLPIAGVREILQGSVEHFEDPCEPMIPVEDWEMLK